MISSLRHRSRRSRRSGRSRRSRRSPLRRVRPLHVTVAAGVLVLLALGVLGLSVQATRADLAAVASSATQLRDALADGDAERAQAALADVQAGTASAHDRTRGVLWRVAGSVPWVGRSFAVPATAARLGDDIARRALPGLVERATDLDPSTLVLRRGKVDLAAVEALAPAVREAARTFGEARDELAGTGTDGLLPLVAEPVRRFDAAVSDAAAALDVVDRVVRLAPAMLEPRRTYLVLLQNNAEVRSTGGIPGSFVLVRTDGGRVERSRQGAGADLGRFEPPLRLTKEEKALFGVGPGVFFNDVNLTPDFPRSARLARAMLAERTGIEVDGVLSFDPVAASYLLAALGPVTMSDGTVLDRTTVVDVLLNEVYLRLDDPEAQDDFLEQAARRLFDVFASGRGDARGSVAGLVRAGREGRLYAWSARGDEQDVLAGTTVAGALRSSETEPELGIHLNDATGAKLQYYLRRRSEVRTVACADDGARTVDVRLSFVSDAPEDAAGLPEAVVGPGFGGLAPGTMRFTASLYLPAGGTLVSASVDDLELPLSTRPHEGRRVLVVPVRLGPGERATVTARVRTAAGATEDLRVTSTPDSRPGGRPVVETVSCD